MLVPVMPTTAAASSPTRMEALVSYLKALKPVRHQAPAMVGASEKPSASYLTPQGAGDRGLSALCVPAKVSQAAGVAGRSGSDNRARLTPGRGSKVATVQDGEPGRRARPQTRLCEAA